MNSTATIDAKWFDLNTIHAGIGHVELLLPENERDVRECIFRSLRDGLRPVVVGAGTNIVGSDGECPVRAMRLPAAPSVRIDGTLASCNVGALSLRLLRLLADGGLGGAAALSGIPGTLGGMLAMNAGANGMEICEIVAEMHGVSLSTGEEWEWRRGDGGWAYRHSPVPSDVCVTHALLELRECSPAQELAEISSELARRRRVTPSWWSAGSVFRNPSPEMPAGRILDAAGCKGLRSGPFAVSERHANWIVNTERRAGSAADVGRLVAEMRGRAKMPLECEIRFIE